MPPNPALQRPACKEPRPACVPGVCGKSVNHPPPGRGFPVTFVPCLSRSLICRREAPHSRTLGGPCEYPNTFGTARLTNRRGKPRPHRIRYPGSRLPFTLVAPCCPFSHPFFTCADWPEGQSNQFGEYRTPGSSMPNAQRVLLDLTQ